MGWNEFGFESAIVSQGVGRWAHCVVSSNNLKGVVAGGSRFSPQSEKHVLGFHEKIDNIQNTVLSQSSGVYQREPRVFNERQPILRSKARWSGVRARKTGVIQTLE